MAEVIANTPTIGVAAALTTLAAPVDGVSTTITTLDVAPSWLQTGSFRVVIDQEILQVTAGQSGTAWTVVRGDSLAAPDACTNSAHAVGATVNHVWTAGGIVAAVAGVIDGGSP